MREPKKERTLVTEALVEEINDFAKMSLTMNDMKAYNLASCFSDTGLGVHSCNPLAPLPDGRKSELEEENYCSLHFICTVHLGARYGVGLKDGEPYDFEKSKALCKKLSFPDLVKAIREKQQDTIKPAAPKAEPVKMTEVPAAPKPVEAKPTFPKLKPRRLMALEGASVNAPAAVVSASTPVSQVAGVLTLPKAVEITEVNKEAEKVAAVKEPAKVEKPAKKVKPVKKAKPVKVEKPKKEKPAKRVKKAKPVKVEKPKKTKPAKKAKAVKLVKKAKPAKRVKKARKIKVEKPDKIKPAKAKRESYKAANEDVKQAKAEASGSNIGVGPRGRPRVREYDPSVHCPKKKPAYWRSLSAAQSWKPDHKLSVEEVRERLRVAGFRAATGSRMGVLLDCVKSNGGASVEDLREAWINFDYKLQPLNHVLKLAVKVGAFSMKGDRYVLGGRA